MDRIKITVCFTLLASGLLEAQVNRYMVFFEDKASTPHTIASPETFLSNRAIQRRSNQNIAIIGQDLPVTPGYVDGVRNEGATVLYKTKWMNGVLVECTSAKASALEALTFVNSVEYVAPGSRPSAGGGRVRSQRKFSEVTEGTAATDTQLSMLGMDAMHTAGYRGEGMLIAILDAGFPGADTISFFKHVFDEGRFDAATSYDFVSGASNVFKHNNHGTHVWSTIGAFKNGQYIGGAYKANFILFVTEHAPTEYRVEEYNWLFAAEKADSAGVDVITTSLGYTTFDESGMDYSPSDMNGQTTVITRAAEIAASKGMAVVASAGNEGQGSPTTIGAPSDGENILAVGAVTAAGTISSFSSIGPSADGRIKPDVAAMGSGVSIIQSNGNIGMANGTSFSGPLTAALVTGLWQESPELTAVELLDKVRSIGSQFDNPDNLLGYGIPDYFNNPPVANNQNAIVNVDVPKSIVLTGSDVEGDALTFTILTEPSHGTLSGTVPNLTYTPFLSFIGSDSFTFLVNDGTTDSNTATVSIVVDIVTSNDPEISSTDFVSIFPNPALNQIRIEFKGTSPSDDQLKIDLVDSKGATSNIEALPISNKEFLIDISKLKPGLYLLRCQRGKHQSIHKILKIE